jgi:hypothetical protein
MLVKRKISWQTMLQVTSTEIKKKNTIYPMVRVNVGRKWPAVKSFRLLDITNYSSWLSCDLHQVRIRLAFPLIFVTQDSGLNCTHRLVFLSKVQHTPTHIHTHTPTHTHTHTYTHTHTHNSPSYNKWPEYGILSALKTYGNCYHVT